jgi:hypothetical protein
MERGAAKKRRKLKGTKTAVSPDMVAHGVIQNTMKRRSHGHLKHPDQTP